MKGKKDFAAEGSDLRAAKDTGGREAGGAGGQNRKDELAMKGGKRPDMKEKQRIVVGLMTDYMLRLLRTPLDEQLRWTGTMTDLAEATHLVWLTGRVLGPNGRPMAYKDMLERVCGVLHRAVPPNPHALLCRARGRKGIHSCSVLTRYVELIFQAHLVNPFQMDVTQD